MFDDPSDNNDQLALLPPCVTAITVFSFFSHSLLRPPSRCAKPRTSIKFTSCPVRLFSSGSRDWRKEFLFLHLDCSAEPSLISSIGKNCSSSQSSEICSSPLR